MSEKVKDPSIETLRGIAILLVVAGYIIRDDLGHAGYHTFSESLKFIYYLLKPIRIPLFTVISAYLYAAAPATKETFKRLIQGKARRILIPFIVVSAVQYIFYSFVPVHGPHPLNKILNIYLFPLEQFWFLYSIFWIFLIVGALDSLNALDTPRKWSTWLGIAVILHVNFETTRLFSIWGVNQLFPFFLLGYGLRKFSKNLFIPRRLFIYLSTVLCAYALYFFIYRLQLWEFSRYMKLLRMLISLSALPLIFYCRPKINLFATIGYYAFGIHIFFKISSAFPKLLFQHFHEQNDLLIFITLVGCGVGFSMVLQSMMEQFSFTRRFVLGLKEDSKPLNRNLVLTSDVQIKPVEKEVVLE